ncbi:hypothetical protein [Aequorivita antarctica]|uniref:Uncharacterized protein n=1 Tax=Aequorivita antarctica TaxID=153266 RepID=A0A5C6YZL0_9FLAO|nr:hypothetical protein [Aequorivita antarctica]TXD72517.1 hypothetical protein ESU54_11935 [Aequorivita antarctica]SRX75389.1 hypothetical protein AEQU3_02383 [Aequorivita antarctica]
MKKTTLFYSFNLIAIVFISTIAFAQVGINTTDPKGVIDFNSSTLGVVYPNVALLATNDPTPVVNPQGGPIVEGTVVYNTNTTNNGLITDIYPGIYVWNGSEWVVHYKKRQSALHNQTALLRTESNFVGGYQDVPGLGISDAKTFTAKYSGLYRIEVKTNFAGGRTETNSSIFVSQATGQFRFLFGGTPYSFETKAFSAFSSYIGGGKHYEGIWKESYETTYVNLNAGTTYPFSLSFDAYDALGFLGNGSTGPTSVNLINENFESYTVVQTFTPDPECPTAGWVASAAANQCSGCSGKTLNINANDNTNCQQSATAQMSFTPTVNTVNISFDYRFREKPSNYDRFRVYLHDGTAQVGPYLVDHVNTSDNRVYNGSHTVIAGTTYTLRFEYVNTSRGFYASVDNVVISELSGPISDEGRGYVGNEVDCQIEFTYIGE